MVISMTDRSLSSLYRRLNAQPQSRAEGLLDADTLVAAASGSLSGDRRDEVAARLSRSDLQTDLVRMLRELAPEAEALASVVNERKAQPHQRTGRNVRHAATARQRPAALRWSGLAACFAIAIGAVSWHQHKQHLEEEAMIAAMEAAARPDRIFTSTDRIFSTRVDAGAGHGHEDRLFNSSFNGS
jgi:anti-sigma factor RsiW